MLPLSPAVFAILSELVEARIGVHYNEGDRELFATKVGPRAIAAGFESMLDYYYYLRYDPDSQAEFDALIEALVVNETYFFREAQQLTVLVDSLLRPLLATGKRPRIWSAACSTGEEPLTLAILLAQRGLLDRVEIVASDISARALAQAERGEYGRRSLRALPRDLDERWIRVTGDTARVNPALVSAIHWRRVNLIDGGQVLALGRFDAIVCRNVFIYFNDTTLERVAGLLLNALEPDGHLLVGATESLLRFGNFACRERSGAFFYGKVTG